MKKQEVKDRITEIGIVPVVRASSAKQAMLAAEAVRAGGIPIVEITMTVPGAVEVISHLAKSMGSDVLIGAGTVLDAGTAERCIMNIIAAYSAISSAAKWSEANCRVMKGGSGLSSKISASTMPATISDWNSARNDRQQWHPYKTSGRRCESAFILRRHPSPNQYILNLVARDAHLLTNARVS